MNNSPNWNQLIERVRQESVRSLANHRSNGVAIINIHLAVDVKGIPLGWVVHDGLVIEPSRNAADLLKALSSSSANLTEE